MSPRITQAPEKAITVTEDSTATIVCQAFGFPSPVIQWFKAFSTLPQGRSTVVNGTLKISRFSLQDIGSYQCKATNKLGSITTATSLQFRKKQGKIFEPFQLSPYLSEVHIYSYSLILHGYITNSQYDQLDSSVGRALTDIADVMGSNLVQTSDHPLSAVRIHA